MKLVNPLYYPLAIFAGGITLILAVRLVRIPNLIAIPTAIAVATGVAIPISKQVAQQLKIQNPDLAKEIKTVQQQANLLINKAQELRKEATNLLTDSSQLELLAAVEYTCDRIIELPNKIDRLSHKLSGADSLLSPQAIQQKIAEARQRQQQSSGVTSQQLQQLIDSLENNLRLAQQGEDVRQSQVISLNTLVTNSAGLLQQLQNSLRTSNLANNTEIDRLKELNEELKSIQVNVDLLIS